ncbi:DUF4230 domain-containing protein [bacterium]|nr:DUF4230 domain-containing protein [bacterium]MBU1073454.1 DUF4230 domain-containing protein [bacterium]MBU1674689.1 DUF4230 domain-containing protein [bacterium]
MQNLMTGAFIGLIVAAVVALTWRVARRGRGKGRRPGPPSIESFVTSMRAVGELSVFRIMTKEVITASEHWFGEFGKKYLNWLLSEQRITLVMEFDVDFRYDLTDPACRVTPTGPDSCRITLPPCRHEVFLRDMRIHSEDKPELLPWLMPDLVGRFFTGGFSVDAKNQLIAETRQESRRFAADLVRKVESEAQASAIRTLSTLTRGLGYPDVDFAFTPSPEFKATVDSSQLEKRLQLAVDATDPEAGRWD